MLYKKIDLMNYDYSKEQPYLVAYLQDTVTNEPNFKRPAMVICPGGGYEMLSNRESEPVALAFLNQGYQVFVLNYTILNKEAKQLLFPIPLYQLAQAIALIRQNSNQWTIDPDRISIIGFSAGGHLCSAYSNLYHDPLFYQKLGYSLQQIKINACILCYPAIDLTTWCPGEVIKQITDDDKFINPTNLVNKQTPPTFIWHTVSDDLVPVINTMNYAMELLKQGIDHECHTYHQGRHGLSLANKQSAKLMDKRYIDDHVASWFALALNWLEKL